jgi:hypothetical protein
MPSDQLMGIPSGLLCRDGCSWTTQPSCPHPAESLSGNQSIHPLLFFAVHLPRLGAEALGVMTEQIQVGS